MCLCAAVVSKQWQRTVCPCLVSVSAAWTNSACDFACSWNLFYVCLPVGIGFQTWDLEYSAAIMWCPVYTSRNSKWVFVLLELWLAVWVDKSILHVNQCSASVVNFSLSWNLSSFLTCSGLIFDWFFLPFCGSLLLLFSLPQQLCKSHCLLIPELFI